MEVDVTWLSECGAMTPLAGLLICLVCDPGL